MKTFNDFSLTEPLLESISKMDFVKPTKIQSAVIPSAIQGKDLLACAETGSGKTVAFAVPMIARMTADPQMKALVLAPTRELAKQITDVIRQLATSIDEINVVALVGGTDFHRQVRALKREPRIIVATPGRLKDHLQRQTLDLRSTRMLVLDEGDRMIDMGFAPQLDVILRYLPRQRQTLLFSATLADDIKKLAGKYLKDPKSIRLGKGARPVSSIRQSVIQVSFKDKDDRLLDELNRRTGSVIVFAKTKNRTDILARYLLEYGFSVRQIHGDRTQGQRNKAISDFRDGKCRILCATDVAARGIDIPQVEHVINFDLPVQKDDYIHRIGRTARNGASGEAVSFVTPEEHFSWNSLAKKFNIPGAVLKTPDSKAKSSRPSLRTAKKKSRKSSSPTSARTKKRR